MFRHTFYFFFVILLFIHERKEVIVLSKKTKNIFPIEAKKCGTVTVSVYRDAASRSFFYIEADNEDILPVSYVIEDTLSLY